MGKCNHTRWLRLWRKDKSIMLEASERPRRLLQDIRDVDDPVGVVVLLGNQTKAIANFKPRNSQLVHQKSNGEYHLHVSYLHNSKPVIIGDGDMPSHNRLPRSCKLQFCHEAVNRVFVEEESYISIAKANNYIYRRLILPFADVVCIFVEDVGGIDIAIRRLKEWSYNGQSPSTLFVRPALILVVERGQKFRAENAVNEASLSDHFQRIRVVTVCVRTLKLRSRSVKMKPKQCLALRKEILQSLDVVQQARSIAGTLFSARHTVEFLVTAPESAVCSSWQPFDFIKRSRANNPIDADFSSHLMAFIRHFDDDTLKKVALPHAASSIILDQYPPGMHAFRSQDVFNSLYYDACAQASKDLEKYRLTLDLPALCVDIVSLIRSELSKGYRKYKELESSKELHIRNLANLHGNFAFPLSAESCFSCLRRRPMYCLPCGHWVCQTCIKIFYSQGRNDPWLFCVDKCILCGRDTAELRIRVKPDTATARVLSIDGGGARGRIPLEFLQILQNTIGLPYPVQRNFDVVYGTSSGAMSACALFINGWSIEKCIRYFEKSSRSAFEKRQLLQLFVCLFGYIPILSPAFRFVVSLLVDSKYSAKKLEMIQQEVYGMSRSIVDSREANEMGICMGVTLTSTDDTNTFVVTNYGDAGQNRERSDYSILGPISGIHKAPLWEILRCCTAAPYYFTPHHINGIGTFQDGGLTFNNPASIALNEVSALFPSTPQPSIVASFGTGSNRTANHIDPRRRKWWTSLWKNASPFSLLKKTYPVRLASAVRKNWDSSNAWKQLISHQRAGSRSKFFRFDVEFQSQLPALDDINRMSEVARIARETALSSAAMEQLGKCHRAELFLFELDLSQPPRFIGGVYECVGYILCRLRAGTHEFKTFMDQLCLSSASFQCQGRTLPGAFQGPEVIDADGNFRQKVAFHLPSRQHRLEISLQEGSMHSKCHISGSPFILDSLIEQQKIDAAFGTDDHRKRVVTVDRDHRKRLATVNDSGPLPQKRPRLR